jgi:hypothetical protein
MLIIDAQLPAIRYPRAFSLRLASPGAPYSRDTITALLWTIAVNIHDFEDSTTQQQSRGAMCLVSRLLSSVVQGRMHCARCGR